MVGGNSSNYDGTWHVDRRVPLVLVATILLQTAAAVWWAANVSGRVIKLEEQQDQQGTVIQAIIATLQRIDQKLDTYIESKK